MMALDCSGPQAQATTDFAPAGRLNDEEVRQQAQTVQVVMGLLPVAVLESLPLGAVLLNDCRQIVYANPAILQVAGGVSLDDALGLRPGEALGCVHAADSDSGCGTTMFCRHCGAVRAILASLEGKVDAQECHITRQGKYGEESMDLHVFCSPFLLGGQRFSLFCALDISHEKRLKVFERVFFHDVLSQATGISMMSELLANGEVEAREAGAILGESSGNLLEQVQAHRDLIAAEEDRLIPTPGPVDGQVLVRSLAQHWDKDNLAVERSVVVSPHCEDVSLVTDSKLLIRAMGHLIENALEAVGVDGTVTLCCAKRDGGVAFDVHSPGELSEAVKCQVFKRSFSTKAENRGLGLYTVKLLVQRVLDGQVSFSSNAQEGTVFTVLLPASI